MRVLAGATMASALILLGCGDGGASSRGRTDGRLSASSEITWIRANQDLIRQKLRDPESARFGDDDRVSYKMGGPVVCGTVNAKNAFGGYTGAERYIGGGDTIGVYLASEVDDFDDLWLRVC